LIGIQVLKVFFIDLIAQGVIMAFGAALLLLGVIVAVVTNLYIKAPANLAFVRTGGLGSSKNDASKAKIIIDGGAVVIPFLHSIIHVPLGTVRIDIDRKGRDALITGDKLRADITAEFYIKVAKKREDVLNAATSIGDKISDSEELKKFMFAKAVNALRNVAATRTLHTLNEERDDFASGVQHIVQSDLNHNGLTLESVTISELDQTPTGELDANNVFDAQGLKVVAEITQSARVEKTRIQASADKEVAQQEVQRDQYVYEREIERAEADATKQKQIRNAKAIADQEAATTEAQQQQMAGIAEVTKEREIEVARVEKQQAMAVADQQKQQAVETTEVSRVEAVEVAKREQQIAVTRAEQRRADADAERFISEQSQEREHQAVLTVEKTAEAERQKEVAVIQRQAEAEQQRIKENMDADIEAYAMIKEAEAEETSAEKQAKARIDLAEAEKTAKMMQAQGDQAVEMVPVTVERERVEVERENLKNQAEYQDIAKELQIALKQIEADQAIRVAQAESFGHALSQSDMRIWGDPTTLSAMMNGFTRGQANGHFLQGLVQSTPTEVEQMVGGAVTGLGSFLSGLSEKVFGVKLPEDTIEAKLKEFGINSAEDLVDILKQVNEETASETVESEEVEITPDDKSSKT
jgi:flotillin